MYTTLDIAIIITCAITILGIYIYLKATGVMWYGINWSRVFYEIRRYVCIGFLKLFHK